MIEKLRKIRDKKSIFAVVLNRLITIDSKLTFHKHVISLCSKANQKLSALARIAKYLTIYKSEVHHSFIYFGTIQLLSYNLDVP